MDSTSQILEKHFTISPKDADFRCGVKISSLINYYIEAAWMHAEILDLGFSHLMPVGLGWVLSRLKIKLYELPFWPGELFLNTWPKGMNRIQYIRDAEIFNGNKDAVAKITSAWMVIDMKSKRPKLYHNEDPLLFLHTEKHAIEELVPALDFSGEPNSITPYTVRYSDVDMNQHLTTIRYIDFMFDTYDPQFIANNQPKEITVNFMREIPFGSHVEMKRQENGNVHVFELVNTESQTVCFRGKVIY